MPMKGLCNRGGGLVAKSCPTLMTPWTTARQAPLSMGFSRQEYLSGLPFPSPEDLPDPGIKPRFSVLYNHLSQQGKTVLGGFNTYPRDGLLTFEVPS